MKWLKRSACWWYGHRWRTVITRELFVECELFDMDDKDANEYHEPCFCVRCGERTVQK